MGFQNLRNNNTIYILYKNNTPTIKIGKIINVTPPIPKYSGQFTDMVVDLSVEADNNTFNFQKVPANLEITDVGSNIVISCNKNAISDEVKYMKQKSEDILNSIEHHQQIIKGCDTIIRVLNPEIVEKEEREKETQELKNEIASLKSMFGEFMKQFKS